MRVLGIVGIAVGLAIEVAFFTIATRQWIAYDNYKHGNGCITTPTATICDYRHGYWDHHDPHGTAVTVHRAAK